MHSQLPYLSNFIESVCYFFDCKGQTFDREQLCNNVSNGLESSMRNEAFIESELRLFANNYIESCSLRGPIEHSCHAISHGFFETWQQLPYSEAFPLAVTIGNVWIKGRNLYEVTRPSLERLLLEGFNPDSNVDVHVWLTMSDMTVIDLTIMSTLNALGLSQTPYEKNRAVFWHETRPSDLSYEPLLVDNQFFTKVERGLITFGSNA